MRCRNELLQVKNTKEYIQGNNHACEAGIRGSCIAFAGPNPTLETLGAFFIAI